MNIATFFLIKHIKSCLPHKNVFVVLKSNTIYFLVVSEISNQASLSPVVLEIERRLKKTFFVQTSIFEVET